VRVFADAPNISYLDDISPDGKIALYTDSDVSNWSVFSIRLAGTGTARKAVFQAGEQILVPRFSPDGRWIVYGARSAQNRNLGIFVQPFPGPGLRKQISSGGIYPVWRNDGKEIVFVDEDPRQISSVSVRVSGNELRFDPPVRLFAYPPVMNALVGLNPLEVSRDGSRIFLPVSPEQPEDSNFINVKTLW